MKLDALERLMKWIEQSTHSAKVSLKHGNLLKWIIEKFRALALYQYEWRATAADLMLDVIQHPMVIYKTRVHKIIYDVPPQEIPIAKSRERELHNLQVIESLTEQLRAAQKLELAGILAGGIAHDFKNLITVINGYTELLRTQLGPDSALQANLKQISRAGAQAAALAQQLLAFSRSKVLQPVQLNLNVVITDLVTMLLPLVGPNIRLQVESDPALCAICADRGQIEQVIMNLVINARDAMPRGGKLTVAAKNIGPGWDQITLDAHTQYVRVTISDTGEGMDANTQAHIFEPFFTTKGQGRNSGLGLTTVRGIVEQLGGKVTVETAPGHGAAFHVYLPSAEGKLVEPEPSASRPVWGSETILVVEDHDALRTMICGILNGSGYTVLSASNGREALPLARAYSGRLDMMITDIIMPEIDGRELAATLSTFHPETRILFMSGYIDQCISPDHAFIDKPFTPDSLLQTVRVLLDRTEVRRSSVEGTGEAVGGAGCDCSCSSESAKA